MAGSNAAVKPYPTILFYGLKAIQFIFSVVVGATWAYLLFQLTKDHREVLGNFFFLAAIAFTSIIIVSTTTCVVWFTGPRSPFVMVLISLILTVLWICNITVLSHHVSGTLSSACDIAHWNGSTGIAICKLYRALFGITIMALLSFASGLALDLYSLWKATCGSVSQELKAKEQALSADEV